MILLLLELDFNFTDSINLALDAVPKHIKIEEVRTYLLSKDGVEDIHDLHIWAMSTTQVALTTHLIMPKGFSDKFVGELQEKLEHKFGIEHTTFQIEDRIIDKNCNNDC